MKRFWVVLLSIGLILGFAMSASAADVKFSGSYYAQGVYEDRPTLKKDIGPSTALYFQRLRVLTEFKVAEGLKLVTRFDALERVWGDNVSASTGQSGMWGSGEQNLRWELAYVDFNTAVGLWRVGYALTGTFGTVFGDDTDFRPQIGWFGQFGPFIPFAKIEKWGESSYGPKTAGTTGLEAADRDYDRYYVGVIYKQAPVDAGILYRYIRNAYFRPVAAAGEALVSCHTFNPYVIADVGPVKLQAEAGYLTGKQEYGTAGLKDYDLEGAGVGLLADANFGPLSVGATFAWVRGDDPDTKDKNEGYGVTGGTDYDPALLMWNDNMIKFVEGSHTGYATTAPMGSPVTNAWLYSIRVGFKPVPKLQLLAWWTYAYADKKPANYVADSYGHEFDVTATYKIYDNLSYMVGAGYWVVGDYFKGKSNANEIANNYILTHKLTLTF